MARTNHHGRRAATERCAIAAGVTFDDDGRTTLTIDVRAITRTDGVARAGRRVRRLGQRLQRMADGGDGRRARRLAARAAKGGA